VAPATGSALLVLVVFILPGFVAVLLKERIYEVRGEESTFDRLLTTVYYSLLVYVPVVVIIGVLSAFSALRQDDVVDLANGRSAVWLTALLALAVLLVLPALSALAASAWVRSDQRLGWQTRLGIKPVHRVATSWDFAFDPEQDLLLVVTLRSGDRIAGYYGRRSHSGYGTKTRDLFLEERWDLNDAGTVLEGAAPRSVGVWVGADDIVAVEHYALNDEQQRQLEQRR
jgi:Family of unknown function (DUF6338)